MSLKAKFSSEFQPRIRDRGHAYFQSDSVTILSHSDTHVEARVQGGATYLVSLTLRSNTLDIACTCPYFAKGEECKHIWATMLAADSHGYLSSIDWPSHIRVHFDDAAASKLRVSAQKLPSKPKPKPEPIWQRQLSLITHNTHAKAFRDWSARREIFYVIDLNGFYMDEYVSLEVGIRERKSSGDWSKVRPQRINKSAIASLKDPLDRDILAILSGAAGGYFPTYDSTIPTRFTISNALQPVLVPLMCQTGRCVIRTTDKNAEVTPLKWDDGAPWQFCLVVQPDESKNEYELRGVLRRDDERLEINSALLITDALLITNDHRVSLCDSKAARPWHALTRHGEKIKVPWDHSELLISQLLASTSDFNIELPEELQFEKIGGVLSQSHLIVRKPRYAYRESTPLEVEVLFHYGASKINAFDARPGLWERERRRFLERDRETEASALSELTKLGFKLLLDYENNQRLELTPKKLPHAVRALIEKGWKVEAEGKLYRDASTSSFSVSSGIDWFELHGGLDFGDGLQVKLPELLGALRRGESMIALSDGTVGLLPEEWLQRYGLLASLGHVEGDHLWFRQTQAGVLDALLAAHQEIACDETFARVREQWQNFRGITPVDEPSGFVGTLREYQREGLGWFEFLRRFKFGGCLADDMGLGKTVQVLALLESRRQQEGSLPSLVVVPRSLVFNWQQEVARFTPNLRLLIHSGAERTKGTAHFENYDLIIITYGTLRRDAVHFQNFEFDFVILDEAQAIKNAKTESAKAVRLLKSRHRLALSGTPVENHLGELWSLFDFLNPGMLGAASVFQLSTGGPNAPDDETRKLLSRALRPFLLRRTKQQVAPELPEKLEQTIYCEMEEAQRRQYNELRDFYRASLLKKIESVGIKGAKIQILEALLRLRQAACHPGLLKESNGRGESAGNDEDEASAKLSLLLPQLAEVTEEGHKALVFSQFTSFLSIVRQRLDREGIAYEYLDGKTRDRQSPVERFQNDPDCKLFLISLKAGGQGLNLTAAEYVFLLDPWWNPAVESQAIDRAHRIGQTRHVFAYRLITRDTVEEKVLSLQSHKRALADAIINEDNSLLRTISGEDLALLLS